MDHQFDESYPFVYIGHVCKGKGTVNSNIKVIRLTYKAVASIIPVSTTSRDSKSSCNAHLQHKK